MLIRRLHRTLQLQAMSQITQVAGGDAAHSTVLESRSVTFGVHTLVALQAFSDTSYSREAVLDAKICIYLR